MSQSNLIPPSPDEPFWDITFTRLTSALRPCFDAFVVDLARRFQKIGLRSDVQVRHTPRGVSTFLSLVGQRGLICIVDITLVDGMATGQGPSTLVKIRLLDACGDVVADSLASGPQCCSLQDTSAIAALTTAHLDRTATAVYVATLAQFDLLQPLTRCG